MARNAALCYFVVHWLARRLPNTLQRLMLLKRFYVLFEPFYDGPRAVSVNQGRIEMSTGKPAKSFALVVVDESHHIYSVRQLRDQVESYVKGETRRVLISDISQSLGWGEARYPSATHFPPPDSHVC